MLITKYENPPLNEVPYYINKTYISKFLEKDSKKFIKLS